MEREAANWRFDEIHKDEPFHNGAGESSETRSLEFPYHYSDGVNVWVSAEDLGLGGDFLRTKPSGEPVDDDPSPEHP